MATAVGTTFTYALGAVPSTIAGSASSTNYAGVAAAPTGDIVTYRLAVVGAPRGLGPTLQVPTVAASTYALIGTAPAGAIGVRFFLLSGGSAAVNFVVASSSTNAASGFVVPLSNPSASGAPLTHDVDLANGMGVYIVGPYTASSQVGFRYL
jgi:hypothetical protein